LVVENIDIEKTVRDVKENLAREQGLSPALKSSLEVLLLLVSILLNRMNLNSRNSSKPPSADPNRTRRPRKKTGARPGGQNGHAGHHLAPVAEPDEVQELHVDRRTLPRGVPFSVVGYERRQVIDFDISRYVTEYRAEMLEDAQGNRYVAAFPDSVSAPVQYGIGVKANAVYMSNFQLLPYNRIEDHFSDQMGLGVSAASVFNFSKEAYRRLGPFEHWAVAQLRQEAVVHVDETGINIGGRKNWLHSASSDRFTLFMAHAKRGKEAMDEMGVLPQYAGTLVHDHWKPYYQYTTCRHALCNAHHLRELERAWEQDNMRWAKQMKAFLLDLNRIVEDAGGELPQDQAERHRKRYRRLLRNADSECPPPDESKRKPGQRGRMKRTKSRNLLERLRNFEDDVLRFMVEKPIPFTNNRGENDLRARQQQAIGRR